MQHICAQVYRGQHGDNSDELRSLLGSLTFCDLKEIAQVYARHPNDSVRFTEAEQPRLLTATVAITNPLFVTPTDPFVDFSLLLEKLPLDAIKAFALKHASWVEDTSVWVEEYASEFASPAELLEKIPAALSQLYIQAYPLLDDPDFVALAVKNGFDGAVHAGSGVGFGSVEYRIFDVKQASILSIETLN